MNYDTYFLDSQEALKSASKKNKVYAKNNIVWSTQICYYDGEKLKNPPFNCINVPFDNFVEYFSSTKNRIPKILNADGIGRDKSLYYQDKFQKNLEIVYKNLESKINKLKQQITLNSPDFNEKKLRVFAHACKETVLIKYFIMDIMKVFEKLNSCVVYIHKQEDLESCSEYHYLKALCDFNPHITININHLNNDFLNKDVFNFVWFQDLMPLMLNNERVCLRKRDYIFCLTGSIKKLLKKKGIESYYQPFSIDYHTYKKRENIKRENKLVFIGSSYKKSFDNLNESRKYTILKKLMDIYLSMGVIPTKDIEQIIKEYGGDENTNITIGQIVNYIERDIMIKELIKLDLGMPIEIYGYDFDLDDEIKPYWKGIVNYGEDLSKIYNGAKYFFVAGGYIIQQRTLEGLSSGSIPIVLDVRKNDKTYDNQYNDCFLFFNTPNQIKESLKNNINKEKTMSLLEKHSYDAFAKKILKIVNENI